MFKVIAGFVLILSFSTAIGQSVPRPKLVVGIVIDQMRWDYLYRYYDRYQAGGFKRFLNEGFTCENNMIDYAPTVTAIGHSTIYTGSVPAIHGMTGNEFIIEKTGEWMYCTEDSTVNTVGSTSLTGKMSPKNLLASTITDELKLATNFRSKVIGIALKDRGAILPAGHLANAAYWYDDLNGSWVTSSYYMQQLPGWVQDFNSQKLVDKYLAQKWETLYPLNTYKQSTADSTAYEGVFRTEKAPIFPHNLPAIRTGDYNAIRSTPFGNTLTLDFAKAAIDKENLGKSGFTDFLAVSCSSTDYLGHQFGPNSVEVEDCYLRLDKDLASFFIYLDQKVGKGNYLVFLSADHGAAHNPQFLKDNNIPAGLWPGNATLAGLNTLLEKKFGKKQIILSFNNYQVHLNNTLIAANNLDETAIRKECVTYLNSVDGVVTAIDMNEVRSAPIPKKLVEMIINGYHPLRSGCIQIVLEPGWYSGSSKTGTTHGSWNPYDAHIPLLWYGWNIKHGATNRETHMTDISATLAALLHIQMPNGCVGQVIEEIKK